MRCRLENESEEWVASRAGSDAKDVPQKNTAQTNQNGSRQRGMRGGYHSSQGPTAVESS